MKRFLMQVYVKKSTEALTTYESIFNTTRNHVHFNADQTILHAEIDVYGSTLAISENPAEEVIGNTMQFCLQFHPNEKVILTELYEKLKEEATILHPLGESFYSPLMFELIDKYGVAWCMFC